ncbi:unnamed protein product [Clavelina lepadiformis]|uniref:Amidohydrolase-related domain-containing protein n=1 Tax=Clavelina lepadiformis TaxID=159417 RepID=A0ABP0FXV4_CLALP
MPKNSAVIDTHFHIWDLKKFDYVWPNSDRELEKVYRNFMPDDYLREMADTEITNSIFVEAHESLEETRWVLQLAEQYDFIKGVVGFVDLTSDDVEEQIKKFKENRKLVGVRKVLDLSDEGWIERDDVMRGIDALARHNLTYDLLIRTRDQYESAKKFLERAPPSLKIIIDHLGKPNAKTGADEQWYEDMSFYASYKNVYCKLSGMVTEGNLNDWKPSDFKKHVDYVIEKFGTDRVMFGSDWPVCKLANANLSDVYELLKGLLSDLSEKDREKVLRLNAIKAYNLAIH